MGEYEFYLDPIGAEDFPDPAHFGEHEFDEFDKDDDICEVCGARLEWVACQECLGEGAIDNPDPLDKIYDLRTCYSCGGYGGYLECQNIATQTHIVPMRKAPV
jgi:hypothetical protein